MSKPTKRKLYNLVLLLPLLLFFIIQAFAGNDGACSTSNSVCLRDDIYIAKAYNLDPSDIPHIFADSITEKSADAPACIPYSLFDKKKDFLYSAPCYCLNDLLNRHLGFSDNYINQSIQKKNILYQSSDDQLPLLLV